MNSPHNLPFKKEAGLYDKLFFSYHQATCPKLYAPLSSNKTYKMTLLKKNKPLLLQSCAKSVENKTIRGMSKYSYINIHMQQITEKLCVLRNHYQAWTRKCASISKQSFRSIRIGAIHWCEIRDKGCRAASFYFSLTVGDSNESLVIQTRALFFQCG